MPSVICRMVRSFDSAWAFFYLHLVHDRSENLRSLCLVGLGRNVFTFPGFTMPTYCSRTSVPFWKISSLLIGLAWVAMVAMACPTTISEPDAGPAIPGTEDLQSCESVDDCPDQTNYDCLGICLQRCASNGACRQSEFCSPRGYCEKGCRDSSSCDADFVCVAGACKDTESAGSCGSKCDCSAG